MSGGSYDYICYKLSNECEGRMYDAEMNDLIKDLCEVLHDLEWWQSGDTSEDCYRNTLTKFKAKWFKADMVAMLKDLRLEIEEIFDNRPLPCSHYQRTLFYGEVDDLILDKINALKGENNGIHEN